MAGRTVAQEFTSDCRPHLGLLVHCPRSRGNSRTCAPGNGPTAVTGSAPPHSGAIRAIVYSVSGLPK